MAAGSPGGRIEPVKSTSSRLLVALALLIVWGCNGSEFFAARSARFNFESGLGGWVADGTDLDDPPVDFVVEVSDELSVSGDQSVLLQLANFNDAGKIWIEQAFQMPINGVYDVAIEFDFASADFGNVNLWQIVAGAASQNPNDRSHLVVQDETGNGSSTDVGFRWVEKRYTMTASTDSANLIHIHIGIWGTSEFTRSYFVDDVSLTFTKQ